MGGHIERQKEELITFSFSAADGVRVNGRVIKDIGVGGKYEWDFDISPLDGFALNNNNSNYGSAPLATTTV